MCLTAPWAQMTVQERFRMEYKAFQQDWRSFDRCYLEQKEHGIGEQVIDSLRTKLKLYTMEHIFKLLHAKTMTNRQREIRSYRQQQLFEQCHLLIMERDICIMQKMHAAQEEGREYKEDYGYEGSGCPEEAYVIRTTELETACDYLDSDIRNTYFRMPEFLVAKFYKIGHTPEGRQKVLKECNTLRQELTKMRSAHIQILRKEKASLDEMTLEKEEDSSAIAEDSSESKSDSAENASEGEEPKAPQMTEVELLQREEMSLTEENEEIRAAIKKYQSTGLPLDRILFLTDRKGYVEKDILRTRQKLELSAAGKSQMVLYETEITQPPSRLDNHKVEAADREQIEHFAESLAYGIRAYIRESEEKLSKKERDLKTRSTEVDRQIKKLKEEQQRLSEDLETIQLELVDMREAKSIDEAFDYPEGSEDSSESEADGSAAADREMQQAILSNGTPAHSSFESWLVPPAELARQFQELKIQAEEANKTKKRPKAVAEELGVAANARGDSADALPQAAFDFTFVPPSDAAVSARSELQRAEEKVCHAPEAERAVQTTTEPESHEQAEGSETAAAPAELAQTPVIQTSAQPPLGPTVPLAESPFLDEAACPNKAELVLSAEASAVANGQAGSLFHSDQVVSYPLLDLEDTFELDLETGETWLIESHPLEWDKEDEELLF